MAVYLAAFAKNRVIEERFSDLAFKMRIAQGGIDDESQHATISKLVFKWASKRIKPPDLNSPKGEKLAQTLAQADFIKSGAPQIFQVIRVFCGVGGRLLGFLTALLTGSQSGQMFILTLAGPAFGLFVPSFYIGRRAKAKNRERSDGLWLPIRSATPTMFSGQGAEIQLVLSREPLALPQVARRCPA